MPLPRERRVGAPASLFAVFDLDGTLIDSRRDLAESANDMLATYGAPPLTEAEIASMVGCGAATLVKRVAAAAGVNAPAEQALERFLDIYDGRLTRHTRPYDGVPQMLDELRLAAVRLAVLTNKPLEPTTRILDELALAAYFEWVVGGDGPWPRKPAPDGLQFLMARASAAADETVLVGDSSVDLETAQNAGVRICLARYGFGFADVRRDRLRGDEAVVDTPAGIVGVLNGRR